MADFQPAFVPTRRDASLVSPHYCQYLWNVRSKPLKQLVHCDSKSRNENR